MANLRLKAEIETSIRTDANGYLWVEQNGKAVILSCGQVQKLLAFLEDGNGLAMEMDWAAGKIEGE